VDAALKYVLTPAAVEHILPMSNVLDHEEARALEAAGRPPLYAITTMFHASEERWTALIDGEPIAMWGVTGGALETTGEAWLVVAKSIRGHKFAIVRQAMRSLARMFETKIVITSSIYCSDKRAFRFARALGFKVVEQITVDESTPLFRAVLRRPCP
jgi:hypothetical protein